MIRKFFLIRGFKPKYILNRSKSDEALKKFFFGKLNQTASIYFCERGKIVLAVTFTRDEKC